MAKCLKCNKLFANSSNLNRHTKMDHKEVYTDPEDSEEENATDDAWGVTNSPFSFSFHIKTFDKTTRLIISILKDYSPTL